MYRERRCACMRVGVGCPWWMSVCLCVCSWGAPLNKHQGCARPDDLATSSRRRMRASTSVFSSNWLSSTTIWFDLVMLNDYSVRRTSRTRRVRIHTLLRRSAVIIVLLSRNIFAHSSAYACVPFAQPSGPRPNSVPSSPSRLLLTRLHPHIHRNATIP